MNIFNVIIKFNLHFIWTKRDLQEKFVSSAKRLALVVSKQLGRSLMHNRNKIGPRLEPRGTPHFSCLTDEILLFTEHIWFRPENVRSVLVSDVLFWPGMCKEIETMVEKCLTCQEYRNAQQKEPLRPHYIPVRLWQMVATDLFVWNNANYVLVVDYYSNYFEIAQPASTKSSTEIQHIKSIFARHGIPEIVIPDNGPQYSSEEFQQFSTTWGFVHKTSSPTSRSQTAWQNATSKP